jgi:ABC-type nitrate/sulfonate/bicarbonate transport system substrate-binding protein
MSGITEPPLPQDSTRNGGDGSAILRLAVPDLSSNSYFPLIAAVDLGFLEEEGIEAHLELFFPVTTLMQAMRDGHYDMVAGAAHATLAGFPEWRGARLVAALAQRMYWFLVLRSDLDARRGDLQAVKGLRIGAAPGPDDGLRRLLQEAGIDVARDNVWVGPVPNTEASSVSFGVTAAKALEDGRIDGFWANGVGTAVAVQRGVGTVVLDVRRGEGPPPSWTYTFPALVTTEARIQQQPETVEAAVRALTRAQAALREDPSRATAVAQKRFPPMEAGLVADLIARDAPYYDPAISPDVVRDLNRFAHDVGLLAAPVPYEQVVAAQFSHLWRR